jgi:hypothetical protein
MTLTSGVTPMTAEGFGPQHLEKIFKKVLTFSGDHAIIQSQGGREEPRPRSRETHPTKRAE